MILTPGTRLGPYEIADLVGAGGMGEVYRATDTRLSRTVAIKVRRRDRADDPAARERFAREARAASKLSHPHICTLYDVGEQDGFEFLVMEFCDGDTLSDRLAQRPLRFGEVISVAVAVADALATAHRHGIVHRDLKPSNIMLTQSGAKLLDFGVAKWGAADRAAQAGLTTLTGDPHALTADGALVGTFGYMAPEQLEGKTVDARTDFFAFGAVVYEMVTGRQAFSGASRASVIAAVLERDPPPLQSMQPQTPPGLDRVVKKCLAKDPGQRWQTAQDLADELRWIASGGSATGPAAGAAPGRTVAAHRSSLMTWAVAAAGAAALVIITVIATRVFAPSSANTPTVFTVPAPDGTTLSTAGATMALSPDGTTLAFLSDDGDGRRLVWLRGRTSLAARPLSGTEGAAAPFWSPDNQSLGFFADGRLKRISVSGGVPQELCETEGSFGGTWNKNGIIVFATGLAGIFRVNATGGPRVLVLKLDKDRGENHQTWPQFLPDGQRFLYRVNTKAQTESGVYLGSLAPGIGPLRLTDANSSATYAAGYLLFGRESTLFAQAFDVRRARPDGDPNPIVEQVLFNPQSNWTYFTASENGVLAYRTQPPGQLEWTDRSGILLGKIGPVGVYTDPSLSPTGDRLAVARQNPAMGTEDIWLYDTGSDKAFQLTSDPARDVAPVWSDDGRQVLFSSNRGGQWHLYQKPSDGSQAETMIPGLSSRRATHWSKDGRLVVFETWTSASDWDLLVLPMQGNSGAAPFLNDKFAQQNGQLSRDSHWMLYQAQAEGRNYEVEVRPFPAADGQWQISSEGGTEPKWRGDDREIFYLARDGRLMAVSVNTEHGFTHEPPHQLFKTILAGSITGVSGRNRYDVSSDGRRFVFIRPVGASPITWVDNWPATLKHR